MSAFLIRTWIDLTSKDGNNLIINCSESFKLKPHPINKKTEKPILHVGDIVYLYHNNKERKPRKHIPGNGLYCFGKVIEVSLKRIQIRIERRIGNVLLNNNHEKLKTNRKHTEFYHYMKGNCYEGYNILSEKVAQELDEFLI